MAWRVLGGIIKEPMNTKRIKVDGNYNINFISSNSDYSDDFGELIDFVIDSAKEKKISEETRNALLKILFTETLKKEKKELANVRLLNNQQNSTVMMQFTNNKKQYV